MGYTSPTARHSAWQFLYRTVDPRLSMLERLATPSVSRSQSCSSRRRKGGQNEAAQGPSPETTLFEKVIENGHEPQSPPNGKVYEPLSSVWEQATVTCLKQCSRSIPPFPPSRFWTRLTTRDGSGRNPHRRVWLICGQPPTPQSRSFSPQPSNAWRQSAQFGTVVYDPPHVGPQGRTRVCGASTWTSAKRWNAARNTAGH